MQLKVNIRAVGERIFFLENNLITERNIYKVSILIHSNFANEYHIKYEIDNRDGVKIWIYDYDCYNTVQELFLGMEHHFESGR